MNSYLFIYVADLPLGSVLVGAEIKLLRACVCVCVCEIVSDWSNLGFTFQVGVGPFSFHTAFQMTHKAFQMDAR